MKDTMDITTETLCNLSDGYVWYHAGDIANTIVDHLYVDAMVRNAIPDNDGSIVCIFFEVPSSEECRSTLDTISERA